MLSDEEKEAIEFFEKSFKKKIPPYWYDDTISNIEEKIKVILNLIEKQSKEIEHQKEKRENQKQELAILNAKQVEFNKLVNTVNSYKGQFKRQQKEIEELKEKNKFLNWYFENQKENFIHKDKIKAKIEDLKENSNGDDFNLTNVIMLFKSLLEKE